MRRRSGLTALLTELVLMILIFALCAAVCLSVFASARRMSRESGELSSAASWAQSAAEAFRAAGGDAAAAASALGARADGSGAWRLDLDADWQPLAQGEGSYVLYLRSGGGTRADVRVDGAAGEIFSLEAEAVPYGD